MFFFKTIIHAKCVVFLRFDNTMSFVPHERDKQHRTASWAHSIEKSRSSSQSWMCAHRASGLGSDEHLSGRVPSNVTWNPSMSCVQFWPLAHFCVIRCPGFIPIFAECFSCKDFGFSFFGIQMFASSLFIALSWPRHSCAAASPLGRWHRIEMHRLAVVHKKTVPANPTRGEWMHHVSIHPVPCIIHQAQSCTINHIPISGISNHYHINHSTSILVSWYHYFIDMLSLYHSTFVASAYPHL